MTKTPRGGLALEIATDMRPATQAPSVVSRKKAPIIGTKFAENPPILGKNWVILKENGHFVPH